MVAGTSGANEEAWVPLAIAANEFGNIGSLGMLEQRVVFTARVANNEVVNTLNIKNEFPSSAQRKQG